METTFSPLNTSLETPIVVPSCTIWSSCSRRVFYRYGALFWSTNSATILDRLLAPLTLSAYSWPTSRHAKCHLTLHYLLEVLYRGYWLPYIYLYPTGPKPLRAVEPKNGPKCVGELHTKCHDADEAVWDHGPSFLESGPVSIPQRISLLDPPPRAGCRLTDPRARMGEWAHTRRISG